MVRHLQVSDAVVIGIGSMIGAGVYSVWSPASRSSGNLLILGLAIAAVVACSNALSSARLAVMYPESGGTYVYGRERLGPTWGFLAGWGFVAGKTASCAAMASTVGVYLVPEHAKIVAIISILAITSVNLGGLQRTVTVTKVLLTISAVVLTLVIVSAWTISDTGTAGAMSWIGFDDDRSFVRRTYDVLQSAGLLFFAFAGYARIATLSEEVRDPERTIPRAILIALSGVLFIYVVLAITLLASMPPSQLATSVSPLQNLVELSRLNALAPLVRIGAAIAALGALLNLLPGVSRTTLAMARRGDMPSVFAHIDSRRSLPVRAEVTVAAAAIGIVIVFELRSAIALSGVGVLVYYAITNASALTLPLRFHQRITTSIGLAGCLVLAACLPPPLVMGGTSLLIVGLAIHLIQRRWKDRGAKSTDISER
jgi:APA family basic amino acid/polyamine antiporter